MSKDDIVVMYHLGKDNKVIKKLVMLLLQMTIKITSKSFKALKLINRYNES